jgi:transcriptional regulator with XRE-family HTH domain
MTGGQMRAARSLLRWTAEKLAEASGVGLATIKRAEASDQPVRMINANVAMVKAALEAAGIVFIEPNGGGPGVRLRDHVPPIPAGEWGNVE